MRRIHVGEGNSTICRGTVLSQWVVYEHPRDYPDLYVVRRWEIGQRMLYATDDVAFANSLEDIRKAIPPGLYCLPRFAEDDPCIVEVWL